MLNFIRSLFGTTPRQAPPRGLSFDRWPAAVYAIGDIHGCLHELRQLEEMIVRDAAGIAGEKWILWLGDMVDRGPSSSAVLDRAMANPPAGFTRHCLMGNHESMMLQFMQAPNPRSDWLSFGGMETLYSYGMSGSVFEKSGQRQLQAIIDSHVPADHLAFIESLPLWIALPGVVFVHAGIRRGLPMAEQDERDLLWIRDEFFDAPDIDGLIVVHGHTPAAEPVVLPNRLCLDTGAFATGALTAARLQPGQPPHLLSTAPAKSAPSKP
ncbi:metallophosphoesterase family protein [Devosia aquimaris]|uniref:metallophosphoesterase family protein n=1 Tax=Devosia aquimaris TaxID=2866214 RepID=UPI001CD1160E|nr:metallophosphoesterase family protein [Devosia sp. CJK-A8-3]